MCYDLYSYIAPLCFSDCGGLVAALVEKDELATLFLCVTQLKDLEESHIVTCLQYFMRSVLFFL